MQNPLYKKPEDADFKSPLSQKKFADETFSDQDLMQKEVDVNRTNQTLLEKRILLMKETMNSIPSSNPQYSTMATQIQMDKIELDELKIREQIIIKKLEEL